MTEPPDLSRVEPFDLGAVRKDWWQRAVWRIERVRIRRAIVAWPFAIMSACLAQDGLPAPGQWLLLFTALLASHAFVVVLSYASADDHEVHAGDPAWHKVVDWAGPWMVAFSMGAIVFAASGLLNIFALALAPVGMAGLLVCWYAQGRGWYAQFASGFAAGLGPLFAWAAIRGSLAEPGDWPAWLLALAVALWATGASVQVACVREARDREKGLRTMPADWGVAEALKTARACHAMAVACLLPVVFCAHMGAIYVAGLAGFALLLARQYGLVETEDRSRAEVQLFLHRILASTLLIGTTVVDLFIP